MLRSIPSLAFLALAGGLIFGPHAPQAGLHLDDHAFHATLSKPRWSQMRREFLDYVPGRNLYILYYAALYKILGPDPARLHLFGLFLDLLNVGLVYALLGQMGLAESQRLLASGLFLVYPNHGETHFWTSAIAMNLLSTTFILLSFLAAGIASLRPAARWGLALAFYALAAFDYDQAFFMWIPLLFFLRRLAPEPRPSHEALAGIAVFGLAVDGIHCLLRLLAPVSNGGRPMIRFGNMPGSFLHSLLDSFVPMRKLPAWEALHSWAGGPGPTAALLAVLSAAWIWKMAQLRGSEEAPAAPWTVLSFGACWFFCAYLPNYFWYISARHNYLPSLGLVLCLAAGAQRWLASAGLRPRRAAAGAAFLFFGLSGGTALAEGYGWSLSAQLQQRFAQKALELLGGKADSLFLLGAPLSIARAPAFRQPREHVYAFAESGGALPRAGDIMMGPTRRGAFHGNQVELFGKEYFSWTPYRDMQVMLYNNGDFACAGGLKLEIPGGKIETVALNAPTSCRAEARLSPKAWLMDSRFVPGQGALPPLWTAANGASLLALRGRLAGEWLELEMLWKAEKKIAADFATVVTLRRNDGSIVFEPVYAAERQYSALWPCYDDLIPPASWPEGAVVRETFRLKRTPALTAGALGAELSLFERRDKDPWAKLGTYSVSLALAKAP
ncbi:MAG: hypothetical protein HY921_12920 [Elusimicrobia bacterium]|nr:hypothetical protein [Elusimicrobiota bacterium]